MRFFLFFTTLFLALNSFGAYKRYFQDPKWPNDKSVYRQSFGTPALGSTASALNGWAGATSSAAASTSTFIAQPDTARNFVLKPNNTVAACDAVLTGTDALGNTLTETFTFSSGQSAAVTGSKAFKTITTLSLPASCESAGNSYGATWTLGTGAKLGLNRCLNHAGDIFFGEMGGVKEGTAPTIAANVSTVSLNTAQFSTALDGSSEAELIYFHNYRCLPSK